MDSDQQQPPSGPPEEGAPPTQQPYQPPEQMQQPQQPAGSYPPPPQRKGFNWLACCGISCAVLLIVGGLVGYCGYRLIQPVLGIGMQMIETAELVETTDLATIQAAAVETDTSALAANPTAYKGQWLALEGVIAEQGGSAAAMGDGGMGPEDATYYVLADNVLVTDVSQAPPVGGVGDRIRAYGQCISWDLKELENIPIVGKQIAEEMAKDPQLQGQTSVIIFIAKEVTRVGFAESPAEAPADQDGGTDTGSSSGWLK